MAFNKAEPKDAKEKKALARSILSDREEPAEAPEEAPEEAEPKHNVELTCPACGTALSLEPAEDAAEEHPEQAGPAMEAEE